VKENKLWKKEIMGTLFVPEHLTHPVAFPHLSSEQQFARRAGDFSAFR